MARRLERELVVLAAAHPKVQADPGDSIRWIIVPTWPLPTGWNKAVTKLLVLIPPGYPTTPPDNFYVDPDLRLADGRMPGNASAGQVVEGATWLQFSYHVEASDWRPDADPMQGHNLLTFLEGVKRRLSELS